jgi:hypothetical protein
LRPTDSVDSLIARALAGPKAAALPALHGGEAANQANAAVPIGQGRVDGSRCPTRDGDEEAGPTAVEKLR